MSQKLVDEFEKVRHEMMETQRDCAWCPHKAQSANGLVRHILENHPDRREGGLTQDEAELLALLQKQDAK